MSFKNDLIIVLAFMEPGRFRTYLPPLVWALLILAVSSIPDFSPTPVTITYLDKIAHFGEYFILGILLAHALFKAGKTVRYVLLITIIICAVFGVLDEIHQGLIPGRTPDPLDALADIMGAAAGASGYILWRYKRGTGGRVSSGQVRAHSQKDRL